MKNVRSNQPYILMNFCAEFSKAQVSPVCIVNLIDIKQAAAQDRKLIIS